MSYSNPRRRGGVDDGEDCNRPFQGPHATNPAPQQSLPSRIPNVQSRQVAYGQPRTNIRTQWPLEAHQSTTARSSPNYSSSSINRFPSTRPWGQTRAPAEADISSGISSSSSNNETVGAEVSYKLKVLYDTLRSWKSMAESCDKTFQQHAGNIPWAKPATIDSLWRDMIANRGDSKRFQKATEKLKELMAGLKTVLAGSQTNNIDHGSANRKTSEAVAYRLRQARRVESQCQGLLDLMQRATLGRQACQVLIREFSDLMGLLDPKTHPMLYESSGEETTPEMKEKTPAQWSHNKQQGNQKGKGKGVLQNQGNSSPKSSGHNSPSRGRKPNAAGNGSGHGSRNDSGAPWRGASGTRSGSFDGNGYGNGDRKSDGSGYGKGFGNSNEDGFGNNSREHSRDVSKDGPNPSDDANQQDSKSSDEKSAWGSE